MGFTLHPDDTATCGGCQHRYQVRLASIYQKCRMVPPTGGTGTDVRLRWRGCQHHTPEVTP